jgi:signal transduction histidine kinase/ActR/RegA family two-component response regulator
MQSSAPAAALVARARADLVDTLYRQWLRTTLSMAFGAALLCLVLWGDIEPIAMAAWIGAIVANQAWRGLLARAYIRARPDAGAASRWGLRWSIGSTIAGALWGVAGVAFFPAGPAQQALMIVCLFGVALAGLNMTAVYKASFYGFVLPALVPLIVRIALEGDSVHLFTALVMVVVLAFVLAFGHHLNDVLTASLAIRYENVDLIGELTARTQEAEAARGAAEAANRAKSQFLAAASHDLRQPLHALGLFAAALTTRTRDPDLQPLVGSLNASVEALEALFAQLLDLSRLDAGALTPERCAVPLAPLLQRLLADFAPVAAARGLALHIVPTRLAAHTDPVLLERILRNLITNALRYTEAGGVAVGVRRRGADLRIDVVDSGVGIAAADRERVFEEFVQLAGATRNDARSRGMGLGLAIVRRLARLLDHRLELASVPGRGSRFSITVPASAARRMRAETSTAHATALSDIRFDAKHVLVIDDDPAVVAAMRALFTAWGARVTGASDAAGAIAALGARDLPPDLIVADLRLAGGKSGIGAIHAVDSHFKQDLAALIVSGDTSDTARSEVAAAGITLLAKPVVAATLRRAAECALEGTSVRCA